ncbi:MAG: porin family protein [Woeseia sp.]|nr:porin family protein [Woeseia sp.]MBT8096427.1 porin family protein [Woeseia sp.]NNE62331.1 porin family protein [Woeseia sp.]NNL56027.1 porin family protein [Woeseia sp.]
MKKMLSLTALCAISMPAVAADQSPFYGSIGGGVYKLQSAGFDETAPTMKILGGYNFNEYVAIEGSYTELFESSENVEGLDIDVDGNVWDLSTKLSMPLNERFTPYGRLGWSYVDLTASATEDGETVRINDYDNALTWGIGTDFHMTDRLTLNGEVARTNIDEGDLDFLSVNVSYRFGAF